MPRWKRCGGAWACGASAAGPALLVLLTACLGPGPVDPAPLSPAAHDDYRRALAELEEADLHGEGTEQRRVHLGNARQALDAVTQTDPQYFRARYLRQRVLRELEPDARPAAPPDPGDAVALTLAAQRALPEQVDEAERLLKDALAVQPRFAWAWYGMAYVHQSRHEYQRALQAVDHALELQPALREAQRLKVDLLAQEGARDEALDELGEMVESTPRDRELRLRHAQLLLLSDDRSDLREARRQLERLLAELPQPVPDGLLPLQRDATLDLGVAQALTGELGEAEQSFRRCLELQPDLRDAWYNLGWVFERQPGREREALQAYEAYLREDDGPARPGQVLDRLFHVPRALQRLRRRLGLDPDTGEPLPEDRGG